ncbi:hypothetical protein PG993_000363 [Apiospora rasikravindrae]|uniref:BTB domain-containing protein n=1 Tax=Apiospora rasikravindrae TaxID=990691 RepID=A0ABR1U8B7_9PEZI
MPEPNPKKRKAEDEAAASTKRFSITSVMEKIRDSDKRQEASTGRIVIHEMKPEIVREVIEFIYTGEIKEQSPASCEDFPGPLRHCWDLYVAADYFQLENLTETVLARQSGYLKVPRYGYRPAIQEDPVHVHAPGTQLHHVGCKIQRTAEKSPSTLLRSIQ